MRDEKTGDFVGGVAEKVYLCSEEATKGESVTMRRLLTWLVWLPLLSSAQGLKNEGTTVEDIVPAKWEHIESVGDLNKDGMADLVVIATPDDPAHTKVRDDGYVYNFNQPKLAIYFGTKEGVFHYWRSYDDILPTQDEGTFIDFTLNITERGTLTIGFSIFASMGSYNSPSSTYVFRYQNGDFYLIGEEQQNFSRTTGEDELESYNYLTHKRQRVITNAFDDSFKPKETWTVIPKEPLKRLGSEALY